VKRFVTSDGLRLAYDEQGEGTPLLCLAGLSRNMADFDPVAARFAGQARVIRMDYRGRGASESAPDWQSYTILREGRDALELLDHLQVDRAAILGTSRGGLIAMTLAGVAPDRLTGAILVDIGPEVPDEAVRAIMVYLGRAPAYRSLDEAARAMPAALAPAFANVPDATWRAHAERLYRETPGGLALRYDPRLRDAFAATGPVGAAGDLWPEFRALAALGPLGLIRGANSALLTQEIAAAMRAAAPRIAVAEVPDRGHVPFLDEPEATALIAQVLADLPRA
jgi:pimeloyl-ACP methyl ester carboxylesterase